MVGWGRRVTKECRWAKKERLRGKVGEELGALGQHQEAKLQGMEVGRVTPTGRLQQN